MNRFLKFLKLALGDTHTFLWGTRDCLTEKYGDLFLYQMLTNSGISTVEIQKSNVGNWQLRFADQIDWTSTDIRPATFFERLAILWRASFY